MDITILQWNIWYKEDIENIVKLLRKYKPDIVCMQELTKNLAGQSHDDTLKYVADELDYNYHFEGMEASRPDKQWLQANGIFSRFPTTDKRSVWINEPIGTGGIEDEHRAYVEARLDVDGKSLTVGTTHMSYTHRFNSTGRKEEEAAKLAEQLQKHSSNFILTGDLNATPDSPTIRRVSSILKNAGPSMEQKTWTTKPFSYNGFEETDLNWRLDYIFATPDIEVLSSEIIQTEYSDHLPVLAKVRI